jgi:ATP-dependent Clp protease ATP-binding subunit ClpA
MFRRFTEEARAIVVAAQDEATSLGHDHIGAEHLLLGITCSDGVASGVLRSLGLARDSLRADLRAIPSEEPQLDADALASIGIDLDEVRRRIEESFGPGALARRRRRCARGRVLGHRPLTRRAKKALELSLRESLSLGDHHIGAEHVLLGLMRDPGRPISATLARHGQTPDGVRAATLAALRRAA